MGYGGTEQLVHLPSVGILDFTALQADIAAAREQYNQARDDYKDFMKEYKDFYSPISSDNKTYYDLTTGAARNLLNVYGGDLLRSAEGRAAIQNMINSVDTGRIAQLRQGAENAKQYLKSRAELQQKGLWDPMLEQFRLKGKTIENWDTNKDGMWMELSPLMKQDLNQLTSHFYDQFAKDEPLGIGKNHGADNKYYLTYGISEDNIQKGTQAAAIGILESDYGRYYRNLAKQQVLAQHPELTGNALEVATQQQFETNIREANQEKLQPKEILNTLAVERMKEARQDARLQKQLNASNSTNKKLDALRNQFNFTQGVLDSIYKKAGIVSLAKDGNSILNRTREKNAQWLKGSVPLKLNVLNYLLPGEIDDATGVYKFNTTEHIQSYLGTNYKDNGQYASQIKTGQINGGDVESNIWVATGRIKGKYEDGTVNVYAELRNRASGNTCYIQTYVGSKNISSGEGDFVSRDAATMDADLLYGHDAYVSTTGTGVTQHGFDIGDPGVSGMLPPLNFQQP